MLKFVFLLTIWNTTSNVPQVSVEDYNLTGGDCIQRMADYIAADPLESKGAASCELDQGEPWDELTAAGKFDESPKETAPEYYAIEIDSEYVILPACIAEDSTNCVWEAAVRGNGKGQSFYDIDGETHPITFE